MSVKAKLIIIALVAVRSSLYLTKIPSTTMLLKMLITPVETERETLQTMKTSQQCTYKRRRSLVQYLCTQQVLYSVRHSFAKQKDT